MVKCKRFILQKEYDGFPKESDVKIVEEELPALKDGEYLTEAVYISVDPYQRAYKQTVGNTLIGGQVAKIVESKNPKFPKDKYVAAQFGWRTHTINSDMQPVETLLPVELLPDADGLPLSLFLGVLGMPGNTAYFGFLDLCKPKSGETVVISGAAGAVGSLVGQLAKNIGCKVIGLVGSEEKGKWLQDELKFDSFINYKLEGLGAALKKAAPNGVDIYFDNVGGEISSTVIRNMNVYGRISVCGSISSYNETEPPKASVMQGDFVFKQLKMEGFHVTRWLGRWMEGINYNKKLVKEGKLKYQETVTEGFENTFKAFTGMLRGENTGKAVVKI